MSQEWMPWSECTNSQLVYMDLGGVHARGRIENSDRSGDDCIPQPQAEWTFGLVGYSDLGNLIPVRLDCDLVYTTGDDCSTKMAFLTDDFSTDSIFRGFWYDYTTGSCDFWAIECLGNCCKYSKRKLRLCKYQIASIITFLPYTCTLFLFMFSMRSNCKLCFIELWTSKSVSVQLTHHICSVGPRKVH